MFGTSLRLGHFRGQLWLPAMIICQMLAQKIHYTGVTISNGHMAAQTTFQQPPSLMREHECGMQLVMKIWATDTLGDPCSKTRRKPPIRMQREINLQE